MPGDCGAAHWLSAIYETSPVGPRKPETGLLDLLVKRGSQRRDKMRGFQKR
jgi:hypothetical protein